MKRSSVLGPLVATVMVVSACGNSGPVALSLASSQSRTGEVRMVSDSDFREPETLPVSVTYSVVGTFPYLGDRLLAWSIGRRAKPAGEVEKLAMSFAVNGKVERVNDSSYVVNDPARNRSINVWVDDAGGWWSYTNHAGQSQGAASMPGCAPGAQCDVPPVAPPPAPTDLIEPGEALRRTNQYLARADMVPLNYGLTATKTDYSTEVYGPLTLGGVETNIGVSFTYGADGELVSASGPMIAIAMAGRYPIVSPMQAVKRLSNPLYGAIGGAVRNAASIAVSSPASAPADGILDVPITGVRLILMESRLANGTHMLLPAYTFFNADGDVGTVIAIDDERLVFRKNVTTSTVVPAPPGTAVPEPAPVEPGAVSQGDADSLIGLTEREATATAEGRGWIVRIAARDGEYFMLTTDYAPNRVNLVVEKNLVVSVEVG